MDDYKPHKFSLELPIFASLFDKDMTAPELVIDLELPYNKIAKALLYYLKFGYVTAKIDYNTRNNPKRYKLRKRGKKKLHKMLKSKREHPEQWGKPKID